MQQMLSRYHTLAYSSFFRYHCAAGEVNLGMIQRYTTVKKSDDLNDDLKVVH